VATPLASADLRADHLVVGDTDARVGDSPFALAVEVLSVLARAHAAAGHYEELRRRSDADLASRGLRRADLPRAAFSILAEGGPQSRQLSTGTKARFRA
jgi:hypothetical protein